MKEVYVLDDVIYLHHRYKFAFNKDEFRVSAFKDVEDFMKEVNRAKPDIILLDYDLNTEHTGLDVAKMVRNIDKNLPIIVVSGNITTDLVGRFKPYNISKFLAKQFKCEELVELVREVVSGGCDSKNCPICNDTPLTNKKKIVTFDDNVQMSLLYSMVLKDEYEVVNYKSSMELIAEKDFVDLFVLDYNVPGEDFNRNLRYINSKFPYSKKVLVTGFLDNLKDVYGRIFDLMLEKPISMQEFRDSVDSLLVSRVEH